jgi:hypothetical protein
MAAAWFTSSGGGSGAAATGTLTVTMTDLAVTPSQPLLPGGIGAAAFTVSNSTAQTVTLVSVVRNGAVTVDGGGACTAANAGVTFTDQTGLSTPIAASSTNQTIDLPGSVTMASTSAQVCQGATFRIPVAIAVRLQ